VVESSDSEIFFQRDAIAAVVREWVVWRGYLHVVGVLLAKEVLEESIDVHSTHPSLELLASVQKLLNTFKARA
jgi:hypothetical protein